MHRLLTFAIHYSAIDLPVTRLAVLGALAARQGKHLELDVNSIVHRTDLLRKLDLHSAAEVTAFAAKAGLAT